MKKNMTNEERNNKRKMNIALGIIYGLGLFTAHSLTKLHYKQQINDIQYNHDKFEHFMFGQREKDLDFIGKLKLKNTCLESKLRDYERNEKLRKELEEIEK